MAALDDLKPQEISAFFGRDSSPIRKILVGKLGIKAKSTTISLAICATALIAVFICAAVDDVLVVPSRSRYALALVASDKKIPPDVSLPLLEDPVGLLVLVVALLTPFFCAKQVEAISGFMAMNRTNMKYRRRKLDTDAINDCVEKANTRFKALGKPLASAFGLLGSLAISLMLYYFIEYHGLLRSWTPPSLPGTKWQRLVYHGWWANRSHHAVLAIALVSASTYMFYFLSKQLSMGFVFALFSLGVARLGFGVVPDLRTNRDGYWGLRPLRTFMQWTYASTVSHFAISLGVLMVWLPFDAWTLFATLLIVVINWVVVLHPSVIARRGAMKEKEGYVANIRRRGAKVEKPDELIDRLWNSPHLPFRLRSTLTASAIYLLIPLGLAIVSALLHK